MPERRILIHSVSEQDAELARRVLGSANIDAWICRGTGELVEQLQQGAGGLLIV